MPCPYSFTVANGDTFESGVVYLRIAVAILGALWKQSTYIMQLLLGASSKAEKITFALQLLLGAPLEAE